jgi:hypothetical protein
MFEKMNGNVDLKEEQIRWQVIKAMLDEFPMLKKRVKSYLDEKKRQ